ncbi:MAG: 2,3-bisphosphoglycerate-independent phosphoglycerate mutase [Actinomycetota bacterium]
MDLTPLAIRDATTKILLVVMDGLGGYADAEHDTELEEALTPHLDALAAEGITGLVEPVGPGITPGSGPGHLALFGYDPEEFELGRGALSAAGLEFDLKPGDVAARGNFATIAPDGTIIDRRAARIPDPEASVIVERLQREVKLGDGVEVFFVPEREHRVLVVLRGEGLDPRITDTDPQRIGVHPLVSMAAEPSADRTAELINELSNQVRDLLSGGSKANALLLRGSDSLREMPSFDDRYGLRAAAIAIYPMYRGIARILGMDVLARTKDLAEQIAVAREAWDRYDYFFLHHKYTDSAGEDGDRRRKIAAIEDLDHVVPELRSLNPDVIVISGDHATPTQMAAHSWHPVPTLLWSTKGQRDEVDRFGERWCARGALGTRPTKTLMPVMLAHAGRLRKYGA